MKICGNVLYFSKNLMKLAILIMGSIIYCNAALSQCIMPVSVTLTNSLIGLATDHLYTWQTHL